MVDCEYSIDTYKSVKINSNEKSRNVKICS